MSAEAEHAPDGAGAIATPPVRPGLPFLGLLPQLRRDLLAVLEAARREQGDVVRLAVPGWRVFLLSHPDHIRHVLQDNHSNYRRTPFHDRLKVLLGEGLVTSEGGLWRRQRRLIQPAFLAERIRSFVPIMAAETGRLAACWEQAAAAGTVLDMAQEMSDLTLAIIIRAMFGQTGREDIGPAVQIVHKRIAARFWALFELPLRLPTPANRHYRRALSTLEAVVDRIMAARRDGQGGEDDLLDRLLAAQDTETGADMSRRQVHDEIMTILMAGHETSAVGLAWTWQVLAQHPDIADRLSAEATAVLDGRPAVVTDLERLAFTRAVIQEVMRLYPPVPWLGRRAAGADVIAGYKVPAGSILLFSPYVVQRDPRYWPEPERFDPERFLVAGSTRRPAYSYFPFGGGPHTCIGHHFATTEMVVAVAMLAARFVFRPAGHLPIKMRALVTLRPVGGLPMRVQRRS